MNRSHPRRSRVAFPLLVAGALVLAFAAQPLGQGPGRAGGGGGGGFGPGGQAPGGGGRGLPPRDNTANPTSAVGTGVIAGLVTVDGAGTPVRRARLTLAGTELRGSRTVISDDQGRFNFTALPAGRFTMTASKAGFVDIAYGAKRPGRPGTAIQLADGQKLDRLAMTMPRGSVLTGVVVDENGEPSPGTQVRALRYAIRTGEKSLQQAGQDQTDDRGMYRIYALQPGDYIVSAVPRNMGVGDLRASIATEVATLMQQAQAQNGGGGGGGRIDGAALVAVTGSPGAQQLMNRAIELQQQLATTEQQQPTAYAPVYYPGTTSPVSATTVTLGVGEERTSVDFMLQLVPTAQVEGTVVGPDGTIPANLTITLVPNDGTGMPGIPGVGGNNARPNAQGQFVFRNITPGQYSLQARANIFKPNGADQNTQAVQGPLGGRGGVAGRGRGGPQEIAQVLWAATDLTVAGQNLPAVALTLQPGMTVAGRLDFEGGQPPQDLSGSRVTLLPRGQQPMAMGNIPPATVDAGGHFTIAGVPPGRYVFTASVTAAGGQGGPLGGRGAGPAAGGLSASSPWTLKSAVAAGRDALDFPLDINPNQDIESAVLSFSNRTQELSGTIQDAAGRPTSDFTIIVFPSDKRYWLPQSRRITSARPATDGRFSLRGLPAGDYRLTAVTDVEPGEWYDPAFLAQLLNVSIPIALAEGETKTQDIKLAGSGN